MLLYLSLREGFLLLSGKSYHVRLNSCHCDRREAIAKITGNAGIASFRLRDLRNDIL
jgi:hypothetical protein